MNRSTIFKYLACIVLGAAVAATESIAANDAAQSVDADPGPGFQRLHDHVLGTLAGAALGEPSSLASQAKSDVLNLTFVLKRDDAAGFERYVKDVYDPKSPRYRRFLSQAALTQRFGPSSHEYDATRNYLRQQGLRVTRNSNNRLTLSVSGSRVAVERALKVTFKDYDEGGRSFYATQNNPALPEEIAAHVLAIDGLSSRAVPQPVIQGITVNVCQNQILQNGATAVYGSYGSGFGDRCTQIVKVTIPLWANIFCAESLIFAGGVANGATGGGAILAGSLATGAGLFYNKICPFTDIEANYNTFLDAFYSVHPPASGRPSGVHAASRTNAVLHGTGQTIGLLEFDTFHMSDVSGYLALTGAPASYINNLSVVPINGGVAAPGGGESEVLLDIDTLFALVPGAKIAVYNAPFDGHAASFTALFNAMINDGVNVISNSWAACEDQVSQAEAVGIDAVLQTAAASGISVFNGSGDTGSTCLDGSANTISVPADSPHATAVGGTSLPNGFGQGGTYNGETWWDGSALSPSTGQGGFGVSRYFARPAYQDGLNTNAMRSIPDVAILADPYNGVSICQQDNGGCPNELLLGGTSLAAPEWAAIAAALNQSQNKNLGSYNALLYPLSATDAFHSAASMGSDFQHVGLGSPNVNAINRLLKGQTMGTPVAVNSAVHAMPPLINATFHADASFTVPADGTTPGGVMVILVDANGNTVSGKTVTLTAASGSAVISAASGASSVGGGTVTFTITDLVPETVVLTATDTTDGLALPSVNLTFGVPPAASGGIDVNPPTVAADGQSAATITVTLKDALNRPTPNKLVSIDSGGSHAVITGPSSGVTDANGQIQFSATDQVNESVTFSAVDATDYHLPIPGNGSVTYSGSVSTACGVGVTPAAAAGYTVTPYVTGLPAAANLFFGNVNIGCPGANNPAFLSSGAVITSDFLSGALYQTSLSGGQVTSANILATLSPAVANLVFGKDGTLYATVGTANAQLVRIDPTTGATLSTVASNLVCPTGLSVDPLSGDLFFTDDCTGGGLDNAAIFRVVDPANTDPAHPTAVVTYATLPHSPNGAMAFAPNGTLYAVSGYFSNPNAEVDEISATSAATVTVTPLAGITSDFAVAIGQANPDGSAQSLIVEPAGTLTEVPLATPSAGMVLATGSPGVGVTGPDGCLYSAHYDSVYRLAPSSGSCHFNATSPAPYVTLSASASAPGPATGTAQVLTAVIHNVPQLAGVPISLNVTGVNLLNNLVATDATGTATFAYTSAHTGQDLVLAGATINSQQLYSNSAAYTWRQGKDVTALSLNRSPAGGSLAAPVTVAATLTDSSVIPLAGVAGQTVAFTAGTATCSATTSAAGIASCALTPSQLGVGTLTATFGGTTTLTSATTAAGFNVAAATAAGAPPVPSPTVSISVSPTSVVAGGAATLTWSSTNATACTASGAWSGSEAPAGSQSVAPTAIGSYTYTLTCTGAGGSTAASATLSATLVTVAVTAKSGGGAINWSTLIALSLLLLMRVAAPRPRRSGHIGIAGVALCLSMLGAGSVRAQSSQPVDTPWDNVYVGLRVGAMPTHINAGDVSSGLAAAGFGGFATTGDSSAVAESGYVGYVFAPHGALEFGYTHRDATVARLNGAVANAADIAPLLADTAGMIRGYGNIFSVSVRTRFEVLPNFMIDPRLGGFFWDTKVTAAGGGEQVALTHQGGGITGGLGVSYRIWRGLELGIGLDHYHGFPKNIATLYGGTVEWRFGGN